VSIQWTQCNLLKTLPFPHYFATCTSVHSFLDCVLSHGSARTGSTREEPAAVGGEGRCMSRNKLPKALWHGTPTTHPPSHGSCGSASGCVLGSGSPQVVTNVSCGWCSFLNFRMLFQAHVTVGRSPFLVAVQLGSSFCGGCQLGSVLSSPELFLSSCPVSSCVLRALMSHLSLSLDYLFCRKKPAPF
jgi:hypothetical protein